MGCDSFVRRCRRCSVRRRTGYSGCRRYLRVGDSQRRVGRTHRALVRWRPSPRTRRWNSARIAAHFGAVAAARAFANQTPRRDGHRRPAHAAGRPIRHPAARWTDRRARFLDSNDRRREAGNAAPRRTCEHSDLRGAGNAAEHGTHDSAGLAQAAAGLVVICGPTGSGKTTTLYAAISERNVTAQQVCSIEDPVEIRVDGIAQVQVNVRAGLTFASGLRSLLRQDPNTISVGEMRDAETAAVAASAALSGQLVLTTLHSRGALAAIERLADLGMSSRRIGAVVNAIVSQRLLRRLCAACKRPARAGHAGERFGVAYDAIAAEAVGCERCAGTGYLGRHGVFEMLAMTGGSPARGRNRAVTRASASGRLSRRLRTDDAGRRRQLILGENRASTKRRER